MIHVFPRSSLETKWVVCELPPVDSGYRGEIHPFVSNAGNEAHRIIIPEFFSLYHRILQQILLQNLEVLS